MAVRRIATPQAGAAPTRRAPPARTAPRAPRQRAVLPTARSVPSTKLPDYTWLIHGEPKVGKTSLVSEFADVLFIMFEPGGRALEIYQTSVVTDWASVLDYVAELETGGHKFKAVCLDTGTRAYDACMQWVIREKLAGAHPGTLEDFGASWKEVSRAFVEIHARISGAGLGFFVTAHSRQTERVRRSGLKEYRIEPMFGASLDEFYRGVIDIIGYYHLVGQDRYLQIRGDDAVVAGCRLPKNFLTPAGEPITRIPMGRSSEEAYDNVMRAFNNEQPTTFSNLTATPPLRRRTIKEKS